MTTTLPPVEHLLDFADVSAVVEQGLVPVAPLYAADLYRDIHKGIRAELFAITLAAGSVDPTDAGGRAALAAHVSAVGEVLTTHAHHEDVHVDPALLQVSPELAERVNVEHHRLEAAYAAANAVAAGLVAADGAEARGGLQLLHLQLSGFTSAYLRHQLVEERVIMPMLVDALGPADVAAIHVGIVSSIPPEEMAASLAFMLPAMNADDRAELLGGVRASAPPQAFEGVLNLARSVLDPTEYRATLTRLGL